MRIIALIISSLISLTFSFVAFASDVDFFNGIQGKWSGPGEIVAGKYKGTKYICTFDGTNPEKGQGMVIDGSCRVGVFSQKMTAHITKKGNNYKGAFLDGAKGDGMDVTGLKRIDTGTVTSSIK